MFSKINSLFVVSALASSACMMASIQDAHAQDDLFGAFRGESSRAGFEATSTAAPREAKPLEASSLRATNLYKLRSSSELTISAMHPGCPQLAMLSMTSKRGEAGVQLVDLDRHQRIAALDGAYAYYCMDDQILTYTSEGAPQVFDRASEAWHKLELDVALKPARELAIEVRAQGGEASRAMLIPGVEAGTGERLYALWSGKERGVLHHIKLPGVEVLEDAVMDGDTILLLGWSREEVETASGRRRSVVRHRVLAVRDRIEELYEAQEGDFIRLLDGGEVLVASSEGSRVFSADGHEEQLDSSACAPTSRHIVDVLVTAPAALFMCATDRPEKGRYDVTFLYWTPAGSKLVELSNVGWLSHARYGGTQHNLMTHDAPIFSFTEDQFGTGARAGSNVFFDMERGEVWRSEERPMYVLSAPIVHHHMRRVLLSDAAPDLRRNARSSISLYMRDFSSGSTAQVHTYDDCPGGLEAELAEGGLVSLHCMTNPTTKERFLQHWSELIDLDAMTRWRIPETRHLAAILPGGRVAYSSQKRGDRIKDRLPKELRVVELK